MSWVANPGGPAVPYSYWSCQVCEAYDYQDITDLGDDRREHIRDGARQHVEQAGHEVEVRHGTVERLAPMATAPRPEDARRGDGAPLNRAEQVEWDQIERRLS